SNHPSLLETLARIDAARTDDHVKGIYIRAATAGLSPAHAEELRAALARFKSAGKFVIAHVQNDGVRTSMAGYLAIAGADQVWLQESSEFMPMGLSAEVTFFGDTLRRYHMQAQFETREEYKTAAAEFTDNSFTPAHREELTGLMNGLYGSMIADIAADRHLTAQQVQSAVESTPFVAQRAVDLHLVDKLGRPEEAEHEAETRGGNGAQIVDFADYRPPSHSGGPVIAVVQGEGAIVTGPEEHDLFSSDTNMRSDEIAKALLDASADSDVKAIVFRVSSPGGSVVASDQILNALRTARQRGKKVVVSMGEVAASGGYYVSAEADQIIAEPTTITGSIGVLGGKLIIGGAMENYLSAHTQSLQVGSPLVTMFSSQTEFTPAQRAAFAGFIDRAYAQFIQLVANGRHLTVDQAHAVAHGRVWTGQQALERHLVDRLGGFSDAVAAAKQLAQIDANTNVQLKFYPEVKNPFAAISRALGMSADDAEALARLNAVLGDPRVVRALEAIHEEDANVRAESQRIDVR
ncbi:MAG: signal peptide peptidase SppA, partial [Pseudomonadota bacterium]